MVAKDVALIEYSPKVDFLNSATHAAGAAAAVAGLAALLVKANGVRETGAVLVYGLSLVAVYILCQLFITDCLSAKQSAEQGLPTTRRYLF